MPDVRTRPLVRPIGGAEMERLVEEATDGLATRHPELSARTTLVRSQIRTLVVLAVLVVAGLIAFPLRTAQVLAGALTVAYAAAVGYRLRCFRAGLRDDGAVRVTDEEARAIADADLPVYTVLVPAYREPEVIGHLLGNLAALEYPADRLEVIVLLESDDAVTLAAIQAAQPPDHVSVVVVGPGLLKTKPRACNVGAALARGELLTIYDAEDQPEPLQLRRAVVAFGRLPVDVVCLQARLSYFNAEQNTITRWFAAEYLAWFTHLLPGLPVLGSPIPLGGTSNHIRVPALLEVGGWDPYNVTEDADLGIRLARGGFGVAILDSVTYEEANSDFVNWVKQRSRWYKGYLQTLLVHLRSPRRTLRELGPRGTVGLTLFVGGTPALALLNPIFWALTILWFGFRPAAIGDVFSGPLYFIALACWIFGNLAIVYMGLLSVHAARRPELLVPMLLVPAYWVMMTLAAVKAAVQLVHAPSFWEKTTHGLGGGQPSMPVAPGAPGSSA